MRRSLLVFMLFATCPTGADAATKTARARHGGGTQSVILLVGDGMGPALLQWSRINDGPRAVDGMEDSAVVLTSSDSDVVTDSAAAATAMATGHKAKNKTLGVDPSGKRLVTVAELAKKHGKKVGFVTTSFVWDATPGAFYAHTTDRDDLDTITSQALENRIDLLLGGGSAALDPANRKDGKDMRAAFAKAGYHVIDKPAPAGLPLLGLFAPEALFSEKPPQYAPPVSLSALTKLALDSLGSAPKGFFLLIEEEGIDEMAHAGALEPLGTALTAFDHAVRVALAYRRAHPDTAVIVLSDHDTGGLDLTAPSECTGRTPYSARGKDYCAGLTIQKHTAIPVTVFVSGLDVHGAVIENTRVFDLLRQGLGLP